MNGIAIDCKFYRVYVYVETDQYYAEYGNNTVDYT